MAACAEAPSIHPNLTDLSPRVHDLQASQAKAYALAAGRRAGESIAVQRRELG